MKRESTKQPNLFSYFKNGSDTKSSGSSQQIINSIGKMELEDNGNAIMVSNKKVQWDQQVEEFNKKDKQVKEKRTGSQNRKSTNIPLSTQQGGEQINWVDKTPDWAIPPLCKDKQGRLSNDPQYDPTTLLIPSKQYSKLTNSMKQYWTFKSQHYDKILFFKVGKFYELFYEDAYVGNKYLNLKWMGAKMHTGFPEKSIQYHLKTLVELGFKVVVIDQTQTPKQMQQRIKREKAETGRKSDRIVVRQITAVHTKGTSSVGMSEDSYMPNYLISFFVRESVHAFCLYQNMTNSIFVGISNSIEQFKSVLYNVRPTQLLYDPNNLPFEYKKMMAQSFLNMIQSPLHNKNNQWHYLNAQKILQKRQYGESFLLETQAVFSNQKQYALKALSGLLSYLQSLFLLDTVLEVCRLKIYSNDSFDLRTLVLDSQAIQHLELFQSSNPQNPQKGTLFETINRCTTNFGKRMLRGWLIQPLKSQKLINDRLDAVEDLNNMFLQRKKVIDSFKSLGDLQKLVHKTYLFALKNQANKAIFYEDLNKKKLKQIKDLTSKFEKAYETLMNITDKFSQLKSFRLKRLLSPIKNQSFLNHDKIFYDSEGMSQEDYQGLLPNIPHYLEQFKSYLKWEGDIPVPQKGLVEQYDQLQTFVEAKKEQLQNYLQKLRIKLKQPSLSFAHVKQRYEIQAPQDMQKPDYLIFSSRKNKIVRYASKETRKLVVELEQLQQNKQSQLKIFVNFFCQQFSKKKNIWQRFVRVLSQIDCLIALSIVSYQWDGTRPTFENQNGIQIIQARHPCLKSSSFIPNDIILDNKKNIMMLTGPNMGGKSTLLRMSSVIIILAQMGIRVPCRKYNCQLIDRIFTRIGASDKLSSGKSTFFIQMQETLSILKSATPKSFMIMDQLGRGTSTFDGMSIAYGVIKEIAQNTKCLGIISTHYHILIQQFKNHQSVDLHTMAYQVDKISNSIIFLYKAVPGHCTESFALNVVKVVGLQQIISKTAKQKADEMYEQIKQKRNKQLDARLLQLML